MTEKIYVTKLEAAGRLLREAIHLFFEQRDELVILVVGSAAYGILKDLTEHKGRNQAAEVEFSGLFYPIRDYHRGILPSSFQNNPDLMKFIKELAQKYPAIKVSHEFKDFEISMDSTDTRRYWNKHNKVASFLKHANRDPDDRLDMDNVNNPGLPGSDQSNPCRQPGDRGWTYPGLHTLTYWSESSVRCRSASMDLCRIRIISMTLPVTR